MNEPKVGVAVQCAICPERGPVCSNSYDAVKDAKRAGFVEMAYVDYKGTTVLWKCPSCYEASVTCGAS